MNEFCFPVLAPKDSSDWDSFRQLIDLDQKRPGQDLSCSGRDAIPGRFYSEG